MTQEGYFATLKAMGITPYRPAFNGYILCQTRDGDFQQVPDPEQLTPDERGDVINLIKTVRGITDH